MVWHYHDDDVAGPPADVAVALVGLPMRASEARLEHYRIDEEHSNAFSAWKRMGSPQSPTPVEYDKLLAAGKLTMLEKPASAAIQNGETKLSFSLPRQAVSLLVLEWPE
jgi:xylan 1,4-beta-xylosidase